MSDPTPQDPRRKWLGLQPEAWILAFGVVITVAAFEHVREDDQQSLRLQLSRRAENVMGVVNETLTTQADSLYALRSQFEQPGGVSKEQFASSAEEILTRQPNLWSLQWAPRVSLGERLTFVQKARALGLSDYHLTMRNGTDLAPDIARPVSFPVLYAEPTRPDDAYIFGLDLAEASFADMLPASAMSGAVGLSRQIRLIHPGKAGPTIGYAAVVAVYRDPSRRLTPSQRNVLLTGYLVAIYKLDAVFGDIFSRLQGPGLDILVTDKTEAGHPDILYFHNDDKTPFTGPAAFDKGWHIATSTSISGRTWEFQYRQSGDWFSQNADSDCWLVLAFGLVVSGIATGYVRTARTRQYQIAIQVAERTAELELSRGQLADLMKSLPGVAYRCRYDESMTVLFVSDGAQALTGVTVDEFISGSVHFRDLIHPDDLNKVRDATRQALEKGKLFEIEYRLRSRDGSEKWVLSRGHGIISRGGKIDTIEGLLTDITGQKDAESQRLAIERKLLDSQKLESLGLLAGGVAHDFNNLLTVIVGSAELARLSLQTGTVGVDEQLNQIDATAQRAAELCRQMLAYAGQGRFEIEPIDLGSVVNDMQPLFNISVHRRTQLKLSLASGLPAVMADKTQLRQIVMNLVINASDAIDGRDGEIRVSTGLMTADQAYLGRNVAGSTLKPGPYVYIEVIDTGVGMSPDVLKKIFDPFFTTKFAGRGLGLAAVLGIVRGHGGGLRVESVPGKGSTFRLLLPPAGVSASQHGQKTGTVKWSSRGRILLADDEDPVRLVTVKILQTFGFTVEAVADGAAAVSAYNHHPGQYDLVILDLMMPVMSGDEALREIWALRPTQKVLLISGYNEGDILSKNPGPMAYLRKPFTRGELEEVLKGLLT